MRWCAVLAVAVRSQLLFAVLVACSEPRAPMIVPADAARPPGADEGCFCNPLVQVGCDRGDKCGWVQDTSTRGHTCCNPIGHSARGESCNTVLTGGDSCGRGDVCIDGACRAICDHQGGDPTCAPPTTCTTRPGLFMDGTNTVAGVCLP